MFSMHLDKAPGPDGFNLGLYQKFWHLVGGHITASCRAWLDRDELPSYIQHMTIVLLPKRDHGQIRIKVREGASNSTLGIRYKISLEKYLCLYVPIISVPRIEVVSDYH
ncbi:hypothetical protein LINGRAHAP2_LOCUS29133 [Linum grandiflorum]